MYLVSTTYCFIIFFVFEYGPDHSNEIENKADYQQQKYCQIVCKTIVDFWGIFQLVISIIAIIGKNKLKINLVWLREKSSTE